VLDAAAGVPAVVSRRPAIVAPLRPSTGALDGANATSERNRAGVARSGHTAHGVHGPHGSHSPTRRSSAPLAKAPATPSAARSAVPDLKWPETFDDWMIDIVRRRALRLNSGARRRGAHGAVRAVELAHILECSRDAKGRWLCALCHQPVTLTDLSFDHVEALADGGEHAAYNLVPAHRKCNEIKGSEKAQYHTQARDRWLSEWAAKHNGAVPMGVIRHPAVRPVARSHDWRFA
jgi:5-methylcytosine-specific restriction endonuclease McrA